MKCVRNSDVIRAEKRAFRVILRRSVQRSLSLHCTVSHHETGCRASVRFRIGGCVGTGGRQKLCRKDPVSGDDRNDEVGRLDARVRWSVDLREEMT